ncbi:MAG: GTPase HflX, partial [Anaerolineae bacterium]|nr:GTPase HflX [Anaerolineae bacterium]
VLVWNKSDRLPSDAARPQRIGGEIYNTEVTISARTGQGISDLLTAIESVLAESLRRATLLLPFDRGDLLSILFESATVENQEHTSSGALVTAQMPAFLYERLKDYLVSD